MEKPLGRRTRISWRDYFILPDLEERCLMLGKWEKIDGYLAAVATVPLPGLVDSPPATLRVATAAFLPQRKDVDK